MTVNELKKELDSFNYPDDPKVTVEGYNIKKIEPAGDWTLDLKVEGGSVIDSKENLDEEITGLYEEIESRNAEISRKNYIMSKMIVAIDKALPYLEDYLKSMQRNNAEFENEKKYLKWVINDLEDAQRCYEEC